MRTRLTTAALVAALSALPATTAVLVASPAQASSTTFTWVGSSLDPSADNHSWTDSRNWSPQGVPGNGDSVVIRQPNATHCTASVDTVPTVTLVSFTLQQSPTLCGTSIHGGNLTVTSLFTWDGGTLDTPTTIAASAAGTLSGRDGRLNGLDQDLTVRGHLTLSELAGTGRLVVASPHVLAVAGGVLQSSGDNLVTMTSCCVNPARIANAGTLALTGGTFEVDGVAFDQGGTMAATSGGRLLTTIAPVTALPDATYTGAGGWAIENRAHARFAGTQTLGPDFHLELGGLDVGADASLAGTTTLAGTGTLDWTGGTIEANLTVAHGFHVHVSGVHTGNGRRILAGHDSTVSPVVSAAVTNHGEITVDAGAGIDTGSSALLVNAADGSVLLAPGTTMTSGSCCVSPDRFVNQGGVGVAAGDGGPVVLTNVAYQNDGGTTFVPSGEVLQLAGNAPNALGDGTILTGGGALAVTAPTATDGFVTVTTDTTLAVQPHGRLGGTASLRGGGMLSWTGGSLYGVLHVATTGGITVGGTDTKSLVDTPEGLASAVTLAARTTLAAGTPDAPDLVDLGRSTLGLAGATTAGDRVEVRGGALTNSGTLTVDPGSTGEVDLTGTGGLRTSGSVSVRSGTLAVTGPYRQSKGVTDVATGATLARPATGQTVTLTGGTLSGRGTVGATVDNRGATVAPGGTGLGTLHVAGDYSGAGTTTLALDLGPRSRDVLAVAGTASVRGTLVAHDLPLYHPRAGTSYAVVTAATLHDGLSCVRSSGTATSGSGAGHWAPSHTDTRIALTWRSGQDTSC